MTKRFLTLFSLALVAAALPACSSIRVVRLGDDGGEIALLGNREDAMAKARGEMAAHCGPTGYHVVEQGEYVVGEVTTTRESGSTDAKAHKGHVHAHERRTATTTTQQKTEWRVTFVCTQEGGTAVAAAPLTVAIPL